MKIAVFALASLALVSNVQAESFSQCANFEQVFVESSNESDHNLACAGAGKAISYVDSLGLKTNILIEISMAESIILSLSDEVHIPVHGYYDRMSQMVNMTQWDNDHFHDGSAQAFYLPFTEEIYSSVVAHEVCHRLMDYNTIGNVFIGAVAQEFFAYNCQLNSISDDTRSEIADVMNAFQVGSFSSRDAITLDAHNEDAHAFGWKSYQMVKEHGTDILFDMLDRSFSPM